MRSMVRLYPFLCFGVLLIFPAVAFATLQPTCRNGSFPMDTGISPAQVVARRGEHVELRSFNNGNFTVRKWETGTFLANGNRVLVSRPYGRWICAYFMKGDADAAGWIPRRNVTILPSAAEPAPKAWVGQWESIDGVEEITIHKAKAGVLLVKGKVKWYGELNAFGERDIHYGGINAKGMPRGNHLVVSNGYGPAPCVVHLRLIARYLVVYDNGNCGGVNARMNGVMRRNP